MNEPYTIRDLAPNDKNFIMATFLRGVYYGDSWFSLIPKDIFMATYSKVIEALLANPRYKVQVACLKEDEDVIIGYSILTSDLNAIVWVFVKSAWRHKGIGKALVPKYPIAVTHLSKLGKSLLSKFPNTIFNPFY